MPDIATPIYAVVLRLQEPEITKHCFGDCGHAMLVLVSDPDLGALIPCNITACPHLDRQSDEPLWHNSEGRPVYLRRLTPLVSNAAS